MVPQPFLSPGKLQNPELRCSSKQLRKRQNLLEGRRPRRRWASSNLPGCYAAPQLLGKDIADPPTSQPRAVRPAVSRHCAGAAVFLLYQDRAEIGGEWVMFVQSIVQDDDYVSTAEAVPAQRLCTAAVMG